MRATTFKVPIQRNVSCQKWSSLRAKSAVSRCVSVSPDDVCFVTTPKEKLTRPLIRGYMHGFHTDILIVCLRSVLVSIVHSLLRGDINVEWSVPGSSVVV